jgi:tetratricopeptide (TPR) repeat protein
VEKHAAAATMIVILLFTGSTMVLTTRWKSSEVVNARFNRSYPDSMITHSNRGTELFRKGDLDGALAEYTAALPARKTDSSVKSRPVSAGVCTKFKNGETMFGELGLAAYQPQYADIHFRIGRIYLAKNETDAAMRKFKTALVLQSHSIEPRKALAAMYLHRGMFKDASREYRLALKDIEAYRVD